MAFSDTKELADHLKEYGRAHLRRNEMLNIRWIEYPLYSPIEQATRFEHIKRSLFNELGFPGLLSSVTCPGLTIEHRDDDMSYMITFDSESFGPHPS